MKKTILGLIFTLTAFFTLVNSAHASPQYKFTRDLQHGSSGLDVALAQHCLARIVGVPKDGVDDYFSSTIKSRVIKIQKKFGLKADGIIGHRTGKLMEEKCPDSSGDKKNSSFKDGVKVKTLVNDSHINFSFSFNVKNTTEKDILINGEDSVLLALNGKEILASRLNEIKGFSFDLETADGVVHKDYVLNSDEVLGLNALISINTDVANFSNDYYRLTLIGFNYEQGERSKILPLSISSEKIYLK